jgi:hypothetical protein
MSNAELESASDRAMVVMESSTGGDLEFNLLEPMMLKLPVVATAACETETESPSSTNPQ